MKYVNFKKCNYLAQNLALCALLWTCTLNILSTGFKGFRIFFYFLILKTFFENAVFHKIPASVILQDRRIYASYAPYIIHIKHLLFKKKHFLMSNLGFLSKWNNCGQCVFVRFFLVHFVIVVWVNGVFKSDWSVTWNVIF